MKARVEMWPEIVRTALLGTERQSIAIPEHNSPLADLLRRLDGSDREGALLGAAASVTLYRRVGWLPPTDARPLPPACDDDDQPECHPHAAQHLGRLLRGQRGGILPEWLGALGAAGRRIPAEQLPDLLELGRTHTDLRPLLVPVLGRRGAWLAARNPDWEYAAPLDEGTWQTGSRSARLALLRRLRAIEPDKARTLLAATWSQEPYDQLAEFVAALQVGLSMADEPLLENALDDRHKDVRLAAAGLLAQLADSRLVQRIWERARSLLRVKTGRKPAIELRLPDACDSALARDGVEARPRAGTGEKAWWLLQMLAVVPPARWCALSRLSPAQLIAAAQPGEWHALLVEAWTLAAERHRDIAWSEALLRHAAYLASQNATVFLSPLIETLPANLPPSRLESVVGDLLRLQRDLNADDRFVLPLLCRCRQPWSAGFSRTVLDRLRRHTRLRNSQVSWTVQQALSTLGLYMAPAVAEEAAAGWPAADDEQWPLWHESVEALLETLNFRNEMWQALAL